MSNGWPEHLDKTKAIRHIFREMEHVGHHEHLHIRLYAWGCIYIYGCIEHCSGQLQLIHIDVDLSGSDYNCKCAYDCDTCTCTNIQ